MIYAHGHEKYSKTRIWTHHILGNNKVICARD